MVLDGEMDFVAKKAFCPMFYRFVYSDITHLIIP